MTFVEKYPFSWQSVLQNEAQEIVGLVRHHYYEAPIDEYSIKVKIKPEVWNCLNTQQQDYFTSLFGGIYCITKLKDRDGIWLCVHRSDILGFHYHAPLRVHPVRIN